MAETEEELMTYFKTWDFSLFDVPKEAIRQLKTHNQVGDVTVDWTGDMNYAAVSRLLKEQEARKVKGFIDAALEKDPKSIHAWCNKGVYHLTHDCAKIDVAAARECKEKMLEYISLDYDDDPITRAKVEYGYWMFEGVRTRRARKDGLDILKMTTSGRKLGNVVHHYVFMKVLARKATCMADYDESKDWLHGVLSNLLAQMLLLVKSEKPQYQLEMWTYLAEVQQAPWCEKMMSELMTVDLQKLAVATGSPKDRKLDPEFCIVRMLEVRVQDRIKVNSNFFARIAKFYLNLATKQKDEKHRITLLESAIEFGGMYQQASASKKELGPEFCAQALIHLWAVKFFYVNRIKIKSEYSKTMMRDVPHDKFIWAWLAEEYYSTQPDQNEKTRDYLEQCKTHLKAHHAAGGSFIDFYPRVKMLLGDPVAEVEKEFTKFVGELEGYAKVNHAQHYGRFLECIGRQDDAIEQFTKAVEISNNLKDSSERPFIALQGLARNKVSPPRKEC